MYCLAETREAGAGAAGEGSDPKGSGDRDPDPRCDNGPCSAGRRA